MQIETDRLYIRQLTDDDFDLLSLIWAERCQAQLIAFGADQTTWENFLREMWETTQDPAILTGVIFLRDSGQFCGRVNMQEVDREVPEIGIDILEAYQNQGYGPEAAAAFANWYGEDRQITEIKVCIAAANVRSAHVFQKLGAAYIGEDPDHFSSIKRLAEALPEKREDIMRELTVREYILRLPISRR